MTAADVKTALRGRHPAQEAGMIGAWTCLEEWMEIDLLAISAWSSHRFRRIGYEVKVARGDYRRELLNPYKRKAAVAWCDEFYFAVPTGLLTAAELAWQEPEWGPDDFERERCTAGCYRPPRGQRGRGREHREAIPEAYRNPARPWETHRYEWLVCETCGGTGYLQKSRVEREAPTLWIPADVGLVQVDAGGRTRVMRAAPRKAESARTTVDVATLAKMVRHASSRPDPRHLRT